MARARRTRDELRTMLLAEGRGILADEGLEIDSGNLTFKRVFDRVEARTGERITNASVIRRIWENQADYQTDVLVSVAQDEARPEAGGAVDVLAAIVGQLDLSTPAARAAAVREVCRVGGTASSTSIAASAAWPLWISVVAMATATSSPDQHRRIRAGLSEGYRSVAEFWGENFGALIADLGLRFRPDLSLDQFVLAVIAYSEGCSLRERTMGRVELLTRSTGPGGGPQEWSLFAVGLEALVHQFLEPDPHWRAPA